MGKCREELVEKILEEIRFQYNQTIYNQGLYTIQSLPEASIPVTDLNKE